MDKYDEICMFVLRLRYISDMLFQMSWLRPIVDTLIQVLRLRPIVDTLIQVSRLRPIVSTLIQVLRLRPIVDTFGVEASAHCRHVWCRGFGQIFGGKILLRSHGR